MKENNTELNYAQAVSELQQILNALQTESVDIDDLATRMERANELIAFCRGRLRHAETQLERLTNIQDSEAA